MIRRNSEAVSFSKKMFDGSGEALMRQILNTPDELCGKGRLFNHVTLAPGSEIGWHVHHGDAETYYILNGTGEYSDNGTMTTVSMGDVTFCPAEEGHSIKNIGTDNLEMIALILYC